VKAVLVATTFLTRVHVPVTPGAVDVGGATRWFPLVGGALGGAGALVAWALTELIGSPAALTATLDRMDRAADRPWTRQVLEQIGRRPGVVSTELAAEAGEDRAHYKLRVRRLKALGLTESLEVGYRLSPRGRAYLAARQS